MTDRKKSVAERDGWYLFRVHFVVSYEGKDFKDDKGELYEIVLDVDTLDLEELFHHVQENMAYEFQIKDIVREQLGGYVFDAFRPYRIYEYTWAEKESHEPYVVDDSVEPFLVWSEEGNETIH